MKKQSFSKDFLILSILTVITAAVWTALDIYQALNKSEIPPEIKKQSEMLSPKLETSVLDELGKRNFYDFSKQEPIVFPESEPSLPASPEGQNL